MWKWASGLGTPTRSPWAGYVANKIQNSFPTVFCRATLLLHRTQSTPSTHHTQLLCKTHTQGMFFVTKKNWLLKLLQFQLRGGASKTSLSISTVRGVSWGWMFLINHSQTQVFLKSSIFFPTAHALIIPHILPTRTWKTVWFRAWMQWKLLNRASSVWSLRSQR